MAKGYWIVHVDILKQEEFMAYASRTSEAMNKHGAKFLVRAGKYTSPEGKARARNTIIEFPSYQAAVDCWQSPEYQAARKLRLGAADFDLVIIEGVESN